MLKNASIVVLLFTIAVFGPMVAFAGISVIWPSSTHTASIDETPPLRFAEGTDHATAYDLGMVGAMTTADNAASYTLTLNGLSGALIVVDDLVNITIDANVSSYKLQVAEALSGSLTTPTILKIRLWTGSVAPTADGDAQVCGILDLKAALETESSACTKSAKMQIVYQLPTAATGTATVKIQPSSIVFA